MSDEAEKEMEKKRKNDTKKASATNFRDTAMTRRKRKGWKHSHAASKSSEQQEKQADVFSNPFFRHMMSRMMMLSHVKNFLCVHRNKSIEVMIAGSHEVERKAYEESLSVIVQGMELFSWKKLESKLVFHVSRSQVKRLT